MLAAASRGTSIAGPPPRGYAPNPEVTAAARKIARSTGAIIEITEDPVKALPAQTRSTRRMGQHGPGDQAAERQNLAPYQVTDELFAHASRTGIHGTACRRTRAGK